MKHSSCAGINFLYQLRQMRPDAKLNLICIKNQSGQNSKILLSLNLKSKVFELFSCTGTSIKPFVWSLYQQAVQCCACKSIITREISRKTHGTVYIKLTNIEDIMIEMKNNTSFYHSQSLCEILGYSDAGQLISRNSQILLPK